MKKGVLINGCSGRMGRTIIEVLDDSKELVYAAGICRKPSLPNEFVDINKVDAGKVDVVIDFSLPEVFNTVLKWAVDNKKPIISGTTGLTDDHYKLAKNAGEVIPTLTSSNTSIGINFLNALIGSLKSLEGFDVQIIESHHRYKKDAPSGTAKLLQSSLETHLQKNIPAPLAIRGGGIFGEHEIMLMSDDEVISLKHTALNRRVFAVGAVKAASWLLSQPAKFYEMKDVFI